MMAGRQTSRPNAYSRFNHPNNASFPPRTPGWAQCPGLSNPRGPRARIPSISEVSTCSSHSERSFNPTSPKLPSRRICMGRPYNSKCVETSHLAQGPRVIKKPVYRRSTPSCLLCTDRPSGPSSPTFLDQLIKGINYLDRSTNIFHNNCPQTLSLPRLAANCLERAANSLYLDHMEHSSARSYSSPRANMASPDQPLSSTCMVPSTRDTSALQCLSSSPGSSGQTLSPTLPPRSGIKLPEIPLFSNGLLSLGRLPKFWEAIHTGWSTPEPISKPASWW